jgi:hypothetical protein
VGEAVGVRVGREFREAVGGEVGKTVSEAVVEVVDEVFGGAG